MVIETIYNSIYLENKTMEFLLKITLSQSVCAGVPVKTDRPETLGHKYLMKLNKISSNLTQYQGEVRSY